MIVARMFRQTDRSSLEQTPHAVPSPAAGSRGAHPHLHLRQPGRSPLSPCTTATALRPAPSPTVTALLPAPSPATTCFGPCPTLAATRTSPRPSPAATRSVSHPISGHHCASSHSDVDEGESSSGRSNQFGLRWSSTLPWRILPPIWRCVARDLVFSCPNQPLSTRFDLGSGTCPMSTTAAGCSFAATKSSLHGWHRKLEGRRDVLLLGFLRPPFHPDPLQVAH
jgi:hypothetical protein